MVLLENSMNIYKKNQHQLYITSLRKLKRREPFPGYFMKLVFPWYQSQKKTALKQHKRQSSISYEH